MAQTKPSRALADWLQRERTKRRWTAAEMARKLREAADAIGMPGIPQVHVLMSYVSRWEWQYCGVSERYRLLYCAAFGIAPSNFGPPGLKKPSAAGRDIVMFHAHPVGTGAPKECGFNEFCTALAKFIVQRSGADQKPEFVCGRDLAQAINELTGTARTAVVVQRITWQSESSDPAQSA